MGLYFHKKTPTPFWIPPHVIYVCKERKKIIKLDAHYKLFPPLITPAQWIYGIRICLP